MDIRVNRRNFLKNTSILGLSLTSGLALTSFAGRASEEPISIGVIGSGSRGSGLIRVMNDIPQLKVNACCDILPFRLEKALSYAPAKSRAYKDYRALLDDQKIEAVIIATPLFLHEQIARDALDAGKHVYCEKTMAFNPEQTLSLVEKARQHPELIFQVGHQYHSSRLYHSVVKLIHDGYIGKVTGFECQWNRNGDWRREVPDPQYEKIINWRMYRDFSCGLLGELSAHQIEFVNWITGHHPLSVIGTGGIDYWKDGRETYDNIHVVFDYPEGIKAKFTCTTANAYGGFEIKVLGDKATVIIKQKEAWIYPEKNERKVSGLVDGVSGATQSAMYEYGAIPVNEQHADPTKQALMDFAHCIRKKEKPYSNIISGAKVSFAVHMALQAIREKRAIEWHEDFNLS